MKFFLAIKAFPFCVKRVMSLKRASISILFSLCRLIKTSAPLTSFAKSSAVMRACISLHHALHLQTVIISRGWALNRVHNSCQPLDHLFALCDPVVLTFDLILIGGRRLVMDYPCGKFGDCCFIRFVFIVLSDTHTHSHTDADECLTPQLSLASVNTILNI